MREERKKNQRSRSGEASWKQSILVSKSRERERDIKEKGSCYKRSRDLNR